MAITTLDGVIAGCEPTQYIMKYVTAPVVTRTASTFGSAGIPGAAVISTAGLGGEALTSYPGQIPFTNPSAGQKAYVARIAMAPRAKTIATLCDRVWHNSGFNVTTTATQNFTGCPNFDRDINNATGIGEGLAVGVEYYAAMASGAIISISYTNSAGVSGRTGNTGSLNTSMTTNNFAGITLQTGDTGIRSIQSASISAAAASGTVSFVAYRPITRVGSVLSSSTNVIDPLTGGLPEVFNNSVLFFTLTADTFPMYFSAAVTITKG